MRIDNTVAQHALTSLQVQKNKAEDTAFEQKLQAAVMDDRDKRRLKEVCRDFEAVFLNIMLQSMRATVPKSDLLGNSSGKKIFESLLDQEITKDMAKAGGIGLAELLYRQLHHDAVPARAKKPE